MKHSEQLHDLAKALATAQADIKAAAKDRTNPFFNSRYATLDAVWDACRAPLAANGLAVTQGLRMEGEHLVCTTMLLHASGQWMSTELAMLPRDPSPQAVGSAATYARRYALSALVGVTADEDDDGNAAQPAKPAEKAPAARKTRSFDAPRASEPPEAQNPVDNAAVAQAEKDTLARTLAGTLDAVRAQELADRGLLIKDAKRLKAALKLTDAEAAQFGATYLGERTTVTEADLGDLASLVNALRARLGEGPWERPR